VKFTSVKRTEAQTALDAQAAQSDADASWFIDVVSKVGFEGGNSKAFPFLLAPSCMLCSSCEDTRTYLFRYPLLCKLDHIFYPWNWGH
jgi:hypothetical protein